MSLKTHSKFYYGFNITADNQWVDFDEGAGELSAEIPIGAYTLSEFVAELAAAMSSAGSLVYAVAVDRATRVITISASGPFEVLGNSGSHAGTSALPLAGFPTTDSGAGAAHTGTDGAGYEYATQFILQSYISSEDFQDSTYGTVNKSASGKIEVVSFGLEKFMECNVMFATDINNGTSSPIRTNATGVNDLREFMRALVTKAPVEFIADESHPEIFEKVVLESTADDSKGLRYKLKELYGRGLPGYFETGVLKFRVYE